MDQQMMSNKVVIRWMGAEYHTWVEQVTPERAERILATAPNRNRKVRNPRVARYAADMRGGKWRLTGETIRLDEKGQLLNGQHRLRAIVIARVTVPMMFVSGVSSATMLVQDTGLPKSDADWASISRCAIQMVKAIARVVLPSHVANQLSSDEQIDIYNMIGGVHIEWAISNAKSTGITRKAPVRAALALLHKINPARAATFMGRINDHGFTARSPESALDASLTGLSVRHYEQVINNSMRAIVAAARDGDRPCAQLKGLADTERAWLVKAAGLEKVRDLRRTVGAS